MFLVSVWFKFFLSSQYVLLSFVFDLGHENESFWKISQLPDLAYSIHVIMTTHVPCGLDTFLFKLSDYVFIKLYLFVLVNIFL